MSRKSELKFDEIGYWSEVKLDIIEAYKENKGSGTEAAMFVIGQALNTTILPNIASELAYYGIQKAGELLGIDPRVSYLAGIGIRSSLQMGFGHGGLSAQELFQGAMGIIYN